MTLSFFLTVLALSKPYPINASALEDDFHPPKSPFFAKLNPYLLFIDDRMNVTQAQYRFGRPQDFPLEDSVFEDPFDGKANFNKGFWRGI